MTHRLDLAPRRLFKAWVALTGLLALLSTAEFLIRSEIQEAFAASDLWFFLDAEGNISVWVACLGLGLAGALAALIGQGERPDQTTRAQWRLLAIGFLAMSADEMCQYHERLTDPTWSWLSDNGWGLGGYLRNAWVLPALAASPIVLAWCWPFLLRLSKPSRKRFVIAGAVYLLGAVGLEMISGREFHLHEGQSWNYVLLATAEEVTELLGIGLFLEALLVYLLTEHDGSAEATPTG